MKGTGGDLRGRPACRPKWRAHKQEVQGRRRQAGHSGWAAEEVASAWPTMPPSPRPDGPLKLLDEQSHGWEGRAAIHVASWLIVTQAVCACVCVCLLGRGFVNQSACVSFRKCAVPQPSVFIFCASLSWIPDTCRPSLEFHQIFFFLNSLITSERNLKIFKKIFFSLILASTP